MKSQLSLRLIVGVLSISLFLWGCGGDGGGGSAPLTVSGIVQAPNGRVAFHPQQDLFERFASLFISSADASVTGISPVADGTQVNLVRVVFIPGALYAGTILASTTTSGGNYSFNLTALGLSFSSDLLAQVNSSTGVEMRAFVSSEIVNIDPVSETAVRMILNQIATTPGITLSNFTPQELADLVGSIDLLTTVDQAAAGTDLETTVTEIKNLATADADILAFIASASGSGQTSEGPGDIGDFFPFNQGNTWRFQGTITEDLLPPVSFSHTEMITGTNVINGVTTTVFTETSQDNSGTVVEEDYLVKDSRGITNWGNNNPSDILTPQLIPYQAAIFPLELNSTFQQLNKTGLNFGDLDHDGKNEIGSVSATVTIAAFDDVTVPVGFFLNSVKIEINTTTTFTLSSNGVTITTTGTQTEWFASGIGPVKRMSVIQAQGGGQSFSETITEELTGFIVNGQGHGIRIEITPTTSLIKTGDTIPFAAVAFDELNLPIPGIAFTWNSSNPTIATIDSNGVATAISPGVTTITASAGDIISNPVTLKVLQAAKFDPATNFGVGSNPFSVAVGDFNGDGKPDLAVANNSSRTVSILLGDGTGSFGAVTDFVVGLFPRSVAVGDFNGDGKPDLAVANEINNVSILLGNGDGTFGAATNFATGILLYSVAVGDFNGDGKPDLAVANGSSGTVSILLGDGNGSFGSVANFTVPVAPYSITVGDFNEDGKLDLAVANVSNSVSILLGTGTGSFGAATNFSVPGNSYFITVGDFNGDGNLDLAVANNVNGSVSILLGDGTGSFGAATNFAVGNFPISVTVGDFNGDGNMDLAVANQSSNNVSILLGDGTGSFTTATNLVAGSAPTSVAVGDFNGDGKPDLAVANQGSSSNDVSIFLNTTP